jgi:hypothetical protein
MPVRLANAGIIQPQDHRHRVVCVPLKTWTFRAPSPRFTNAVIRGVLQRCDTLELHHPTGSGFTLGLRETNRRSSTRARLTTMTQNAAVWRHLGRVGANEAGDLSWPRAPRRRHTST